MKTRVLGRTGLEVSEIGFGCWAISGSGYGPTNDEESMEALETAWKKGVNFYDTADTYGQGHSEKILARFLKDKPREKVIIATKAGWDFYHGGTRKNFDADYLRFALDESLKRLETPYIDLYQLHNPSLEKITDGAVFRVLEEFKAAGKIRFIGISVHTEQEAMAAMDDPAVDSLQLVFNLLCQEMAEYVLTEASRRGVGVIVREPLASGLLSGKYQIGHEFHKQDHRRRWTPEKLQGELEKIDVLRHVIATQRMPLVQAALEYVLDFDGVSTVIPGAKTRTQVLEIVKAVLDPRLRIEESSRLRELYLRHNVFRKTPPETSARS